MTKVITEQIFWQTDCVYIPSGSDTQEGSENNNKKKSQFLIICHNVKKNIFILKHEKVCEIYVNFEDFTVLVTTICPHLNSNGQNLCKNVWKIENFKAKTWLEICKERDPQTQMG